MRANVVKRRPSKKVIFLSSTVKNAKNINRQIAVNKFQGISNLNISADLHGHLAPEESLYRKNQSSLVL